MSKYLYFQDAHCLGKNSVNRLGDYFSDWLIKFNELLSLAKEYQCEAILDGGDLFETKSTAYSVLDEIADRVEQNNIPIYSLFGNHNLNAGHIENSQNTGLSHLQKRSKYFKYLDTIAGKNFIIKGIEYKYNIEEGLQKEEIDFAVRNSNSTWNIGIVHALITPTKFFENASYITPDQIKTNAQLILCSHYHHPFEKKIADTVFLNIGAFGRLAINEAKIEPSVLLIDTEKRDYKIIKLQSAKKANEILIYKNTKKRRCKIRVSKNFLIL